MSTLIDFLLHSDQHITDFIVTYGRWVYGILFAIVFAETGLVVTPFLPGDSLLFAVGALAATGRLDPAASFFLLALAAFALRGILKDPHHESVRQTAILRDDLG